jgi:Protein of unknown function (DUF2959)
MKFRAFLALVLTAGCLAGCQSAYYATMAKFGYEKRDLLKKAVLAARDDQKTAAKEFKDALTRIKEMYAFDGGDLERTYSKLKSQSEDCDSQAGTVRKRIREMDRVATDLFAEWENEIGQFTNPTYASNSRRQLGETRAKYSQLASSLRSAEATMEPVLKQLKEQVLYLKHNLNAAAIGSLRGEATSIQNDIGRLLTQMNTAIAQADDFIKNLPK